MLINQPVPSLTHLSFANLKFGRAEEVPKRAVLSHIETDQQSLNAEEAQAADFRRLPALTNLPQSYGSLIDN
jgi:hypothetical protein